MRENKSAHALGYEFQTYLQSIYKLDVRNHIYFFLLSNPQPDGDLY